MVTTPFKLNLTTAAGGEVTGYTKFAAAAYSGGVGYGYTDSIEAVEFDRGINAADNYDTGHYLGVGLTDTLRIDVPTGVVYDIIVMCGDPSQALPNQYLQITDAGVGGVTGAPNTGADQYEAVGCTIQIDTYIQVKINRVSGSPATAVVFIHVQEANEKAATLAASAPAATKALL